MDERLRFIAGLLEGEFMLGNKQYCYPFTISDYRLRYLLACEGFTSTSSDFAFSIFGRAFKDFGLPRAIRTDNGVEMEARVGIENRHQSLYLSHFLVT